MAVKGDLGVDYQEVYQGPVPSRLCFSYNQVQLPLEDWDTSTTTKPSTYNVTCLKDVLR